MRGARGGGARAWVDGWKGVQAGGESVDVWVGQCACWYQMEARPPIRHPTPIQSLLPPPPPPPPHTRCLLPARPAVAAAVLFLGEGFTWVNACGLLVLIAGVVLFNYLKYKKIKSGQIRPLPTAAAGATVAAAAKHSEQLEVDGSGGGGSAGLEMNGAAFGGRGSGGDSPPPYHELLLMGSGGVQGHGVFVLEDLEDDTPPPLHQRPRPADGEGKQQQEQEHEQEQQSQGARRGRGGRSRSSSPGPPPRRQISL